MEKEDGLADNTIYAIVPDTFGGCGWAAIRAWAPST